MDVESLTIQVIPQLKAGLVIILPPGPDDPGGQEPGSPPGIPAVFSGTVRIGGGIPTQPSRIYIRVIKTGLPDLWFSQPLDATGLYVLPVGITTTGYGNATVEF